jgi:exopolysaccharide production protein ExoZ
LFDWLRRQFELARGGSGHNVRPMEGLRGFAVLLVFFVHYASLVEPWVAREEAMVRLVEALVLIGGSGVDLFFVLSGYLIYGSLLSREQAFLPFMARRIQRIYPVFTAVFVLYIGLSLLFPEQNKIPSPAGDGALYLLQNFLLLPGLLPIRPMITVAWSLSYEMFYYLAVPLVIAALKLRQRGSAWRVTLFLLVAAGFAVFSAFNDGPVRLLMFISGILLYETLNHSQLRVSSTAGVVALLVGLAGMLLPGTAPAGATLKVLVVFVAFFLLCLACFRTPTAPLAQAFSWTPLRWLGNMSYSYYLVHGLALHGGFLVLSKVVPPSGAESALFWLLLPPMLALTLLASAPFFLWIERPFSLVPRRRRSAQPVPQAASASESGS